MPVRTIVVAPRSWPRTAPELATCTWAMGPRDVAVRSTAARKSSIWWVVKSSPSGVSARGRCVKTPSSSRLGSRSTRSARRSNSPAGSPMRPMPVSTPMWTLTVRARRRADRPVAAMFVSSVTVSRIPDVTAASRSCGRAGESLRIGLVMPAAMSSWPSATLATANQSAALVRWASRAHWLAP